jgi:predicted DNA-binding transcriptional regulator YafY
MTVQDAMALALARDVLLAAPAFRTSRLRMALDKGERGPVPGTQSRAHPAAQVLRPGSLPRDYSQAPVGALIAAATNKQPVEIDYDSRRRGTRAWRRVDPYAVEPREGQFWELHGWCHENKPSTSRWTAYRRAARGTGRIRRRRAVCFARGGVGCLQCSGRRNRGFAWRR